MRLVVNIPTYNEKENIEEIIKKVLSVGRHMPKVDLHVLVSDSHSPDGTGEIVKKISKTNPKVHFLDVKERGLGIGLIKGHRYAIDKLKADILGQMDGDLSHDPATLPKMIEYINKGYDLVNGSRLMKGGKNMLGWHRRFFTKGSSLYCKLSWGTFDITEFTNSYRVFTVKLFHKIELSQIPWRSQTYIIQPAFLYGAIKAGAKIKETPITFKDRKNGYSKAKIVSYIIDVLKFGIKVRIEKSKTFVKFLTVGSIGYFLSATSLGLLNKGYIYNLKILENPILQKLPEHDITRQISFVSFDRLLISSIISIQVAIISNFILHENWTFKNRNHEGLILTRFLKFNLTSIGSPIIQIITILVAVNYFHSSEQIGLAIGVIIGLFLNYILNIFWIWKVKPTKVEFTGK